MSDATPRLAAWRLIAFTEPYEWEGDWEAQTNWNVREYGAFREQYPSHVLAGEAMFRIGAQYYVLDYCLGQREAARPEYETFIRKYPKTEPYVTRPGRGFGAHHSSVNR